jgi:hypothetical protein
VHLPPRGVAIERSLSASAIRFADDTLIVPCDSDCRRRTNLLWRQVFSFRTTRTIRYEFGPNYYTVTIDEGDAATIRSQNHGHIVGHHLAGQIRWGCIALRTVLFGALVDGPSYSPKGRA